MTSSNDTKPEDMGDSSSPAATLNGTGASASATPTPEDKGHTFRKRRLSLTSLKPNDDGEEISSASAVAAAAPTDNGYGYEDAAPPALSAAAADEEEDEKAYTFRKRRLSLTHNREDASQSSVGGDDNAAEGGEAAGEPSYKRRRRSSDASYASLSSLESGFLKSRTVHASELLAHPPLSPAILPRLYQQSAPPQGPNLLESIGQDGTGKPAPKWNKRHTRHLNEDERTLPFPRDVVGTFSCHGVEPIYDDDYLPEDSEEEEDTTAGRAWGGATTKTADAPDKPTTAAKINQDRGGLAFPYGNCAKTALFAAYDGK
jgi:hypothetical protein